jgi:hypothetical protein
MQRQILYGVPYFLDSVGRLFTWDTTAPPEHIGSYNTTKETITYTEGHLAKLTARLEDWRSKQESRLRKATNSLGRGSTRGRPPTPTKDSEDEQ